MPIDYALILSAGMGTRMGEIGKKIPKVLWPIYFKSLLELQIRYCQEMGIRQIYINTHYLHSEIMSFLGDAGLGSAVTVLHEYPLLDSGGAIHNLAVQPEVNYKGNLLMVNGDQFLFFEKKFWEEAVDKLKNSRAVLFGIKVQKYADYNETVIAKNRLIDIQKNTKKDHDYITYSGLGLLRLNDLPPVPGISRFFDTVANYKAESISMIAPDNFEYWDFGTSEIYSRNIFKLRNKNERESEMGRFMERNGAFKGDEKLFLDGSASAIDIECSGSFRENTIHGKGIFQKI
ncbi:MAG: sugar phosphate nucleotidyltransferase [Bacteriovorax sp.]|jgi:mannose-1-phosphate guanylyltransferase